MVEATLVVAALATLAVSATYGFVGLRLARDARLVSAPGRALAYFAGWWLATSLNQLLGGALYFMAAFGQLDLSLHVSYVFVQRLLLSLSLVGLMQYLLYLHTGREWVWHLAVFYGVYYVSQVYLVLSRDPIGVASFGWRTDLVYASTAAPIWELAGLMIIVPPILGALALVRVYRRVEGRTRRFRVAMLAGGFVVWWLTAIVAGQRYMLELASVQIVNRVVGIVVAVGILLAYQPLGWMQRRYALEPLSTTRT